MCNFISSVYKPQKIILQTLLESIDNGVYKLLQVLSRGALWRAYN